MRCRPAATTADRPFRKSAKIVGEVMGNYHPHGDSAIYDSLVRLAQDFSMRLPLIDGQGNFGSMDGDPPAAMRYTEARLARAASALLDDIDKETVDFQPTYDDQSREPTVLPARFPNLLVNGASGIAVGMATNIPTHNTGEVIDACIAYIDNPEITIDELMPIIPGPDFPTGGIVLSSKTALREAYRTGRGSLIMRGRVAIEDLRKDRQAIIISEIPYQVNKLRLVERIAECVQEKIIEGIADLRDESDRDGVRVVVELKRDAELGHRAEPALPLHAAAIELRPQHAGAERRPAGADGPARHHRRLHRFREEVITRRTRYELRQARERAHILIGLALAVVNLDEMIKLIRAAADPAVAREQMLARRWPVADIGPLIELVDEPGRRHRRRRTTGCRKSRPRRSSSCACTA